MRLLGLIGGMSWESSSVYYRLLNEGARARLGGLHSAPLVLSSVDFAGIAERQAAGAWDDLAAELAGHARRLEACGAEALLICTNTMHKVADAVAGAVGIPLIHIADATAGAVARRKVARPLVLGTRYTMEQDFYLGRLADRFALAPMVPDAAGRDLLQRVIYGELCNGIIDPGSRHAVRAVVEDSLRAGADGVIFGCTEVGLLLKPEDFTVPVFDTVELHVAAALDFAVGDGAPPVIAPSGTRDPFRGNAPDRRSSSPGP